MPGKIKIIDEIATSAHYVRTFNKVFCGDIQRQAREDPRQFRFGSGMRAKSSVRIREDLSSQTQGKPKETAEKPYLFIDEIATGGNERSNRRAN